MTHELKAIVGAYLKAVKNNTKCVLATVVDVEGSSYRRPGVRMLVTEDGQMTGAISGGCIEKDVLIESESVFATGRAKMMSYDGRYRLGCEGIIYILIETFNPALQFLNSFSDCLEKRQTISFSIQYTRELKSADSIGSVVSLLGQNFVLNQDIAMESLTQPANLILNQELPPMFQLLVFGGEYDAAKLTLQASLLGWQVVVVTTPLDSYTSVNFPGSSKVLQASAGQLPEGLIDKNTAVVMMTHNFAKDLNYLMAIKNCEPLYLGLLGPVKRRNKLLDDFLEYSGEIPNAILQVIHGPAGLNIGAETAEEIALCICSEIIAKRQNKDAGNLNKLEGEIHCFVSN